MYFQINTCITCCQQNGCHMRLYLLTGTSVRCVFEMAGPMHTTLIRICLVYSPGILNTSRTQACYKRCCRQACTGRSELLVWPSIAPATPSARSCMNRRASAPSVSLHLLDGLLAMCHGRPAALECYRHSRPAAYVFTHLSVERCGSALGTRCVLGMIASPCALNAARSPRSSGQCGGFWCGVLHMHARSRRVLRYACVR